MRDMKKGFSILELIIVTAIGVVILTTLVVVFITQYNLYNSQSKASNLESSLNNILKNIEKFGAGSSAVIASRIFDGVTYTTDNDTVIFEMPSLDSSGNPLGTKDYVVFYLNDSDPKKLMMQTDADPDSNRKDITKLLSNKLKILRFKYNNDSPSAASLVEVFVYLADQHKDGNEERSGKTSIYLRNR